MESYKNRYIKNHGYHIIEGSWYPILLSLAIGIFINSFLSCIQKPVLNMGFLNDLRFSVFAVVTVIFLWLMQMRKDSLKLHVYTTEVKQNLLMGLILFIVSEASLFFAVFWVFLHNSLSPSIVLGAIWPPVGIEPGSVWKIPFANTLLLLTSGITITSCHHAWEVFAKFGIFFTTIIKRLPKDNFVYRWYRIADIKYLNTLNQRIIVNLILTVTFGLIFLVLQLVEYIHLPFAMSDGIYGSVFYLSTGLHGLHVLFGLILLVYCLFRYITNDYVQYMREPVSFIFSVWYWHFVDVIWLFLFVLVYVWGNNGLII